MACDHHGHHQGHAAYLPAALAVTLLYAGVEAGAGWWAGSLAALAAGLIVHFTGWTPADPLLSLFICALILYSTLRLAREAVHALLEGVPPGLSLPEVGRRMAAVDGVVSVHDLHIWSLSSRRSALSAHVVIRDLAAWPRILAALAGLLEKEFGIGHATLQPELFRPALYAIDEPAGPRSRP